MKKMQRSLSVILVLAMLITTMPMGVLEVFAYEGKNTKHNNPWDYAIFGNSIEFPMSFASGSSVSVSGDAHANKDICSFSKTFDAGVVEAGGEVNIGSQSTATEKIVENAKNIELPQIYYSIMALEGNKARDKVEEDTSADDMLRTSIISDEDINIDLRGSYPESMQRYTKKAGAFGAGFLTKVYENPEKWAAVLPAFDEDYAPTYNDNKIDMVELTDNSFFAAVQEQAIDDAKYSNWDKLPGTTFMDNLNDGGYVSSYIANVSTKSGSSSGYETLAEGGINPAGAQGKKKLSVPENMNVTLQGDYDDLEELYVSGDCGVQLLGNFPNLKYVYATNSSPNLNLAGNFGSLEGVYQNYGTMLLGTADLGFNATGADIINSDGTITLYVAKDTNISGCQILNKTSGIAVRGGGADGNAVKFIADGAVIASNHAVTMVDINDNNTTRFSEVPAIFSQASLSIVNCNFKLLQGAFVTRNAGMKFANSNVDTFSGFLFAQHGIDEWSFSGTYVDCGTYNYCVNPNINAPSINLNGTELGHIGNIEYAQMPSKLDDIPDMKSLLEQSIQIKNSDGEYVDYYEHGLRDDEENVIYIMSKGDVTITADSFSTPKGRRMIIASRNGNITINASCHDQASDTYTTLVYDGILYAPRGKAEINTSEGLEVKGRVYADSSTLNGYWVSVNPQDTDLDMLNVREQFKLDDTNYEYEKAYNTYYLKNSALNDSITGSLHTQSETEKISYKVQKLNYFTQGWHDPYIEGEIDNQSRYFIIDNATLRIGLNKITFTAELKDGKIIENEFYVIFFDENNLDTNDADGDKLLNWQEEFYDTDPNKKDTDGDTLDDYTEIYLLGLNPLEVDTDGNGVTDDNEDFDGDKVSNGKELNGVNANGNLYYSDPTIVDTDGDTLDDCIEVYLHGTDPSKKDTDGDGVDDNIELEIGSDPLVAELSFTRTVSKQSTAKKVTASATLSNASGKAVNTLAVEEVEDDPFLNSNIQGYIDSAFEFNSDGNIGTAKISFTMDNMPSSARIYYVNDKEHKLEALDCDRNGNTISASVRHFSKYILIDADKFDKVFTEIPLYTEARKQPMDVVVAISRPLSDPKDFRYTIYQDIVNKLNANENDRVALIFGDGVYAGTYYKKVYRTLGDSLNNSLIPDKEAFNFNFDDYVADNSYMMSLLNESLHLFPAKDESGYRSNSKKVLIIMDSGVDERFESGLDGSDMVDNAADEGIYVDEIIAIGFEDRNGKFDLSGLRTFADKCYIAEDYVNGGYSGFKPEITKNPIDFDSKIGINNSGIYDDDIAEMLRDGTIRDIYGNKVFGDNPSLAKCKATADFDSDNLRNYEEINIIRSGNTFKVWYNSDPTKKDTDGDGYNDYAETAVYESNPLKSEVEFHRWDKDFVSVDHNDNISYGGSQMWFFDDNKKDWLYWTELGYFIENYGCGLISSADILLYLSLNDSKYATYLTELVEIDDSRKIEYSSYVNYINAMDILYLPLIRGIGILGTDIASGINTYSYSYDLGLKAKWCASKENLLSRIKTMLDDDIPVTFSIGPSDDYGVNFYRRNFETDTPYDFTIVEYDKINSHYVTVTGLLIDNVTNQTILEISSWGKRYYINYDEYIDFVDKYSNYLFSNIVYIEKMGDN